ncbi:MAG TPA: indole-3-glycerol phosphate synthase TrpC [Candidatus Acetothermia bacterium]|nr:indole-3-glycerol phosphate synthase TrpC [Candidatus Acetothermia bacterium]
MILDEIVAHKEDELRQRRVAVPISTLEARVKAQSAPISFVAALREGRPALIAEIKRASPSRGEIVERLDPVKLALIYAEHGANAISVLTDEHFFRGSLADLEAVKQALSNARWEIPVLRKDFILSHYQLLEARAAGADAVLLIASILSDTLFSSLLAETQWLGMTALVEVHTEEELARVLAHHPRVIGINRRDLRDFHINPDIFAHLRPLIPPDSLVVAESGIHSRLDVVKLHRMGADAVLVGEALVGANDVGAKVAELCEGGGK